YNLVKPTRDLQKIMSTHSWLASLINYGRRVITFVLALVDLNKYVIVLKIFRAPNIVGNDFSIPQIWVIADVPNHGVNTVEVGLHVIPSMHKDNALRLFNYWTSDGYNSGCYNLLCLGFVQISSKVGLRAAFGPVYSENSSKHTSTQMGSGHFPGEGFGKAAYAKSLEVVDQDNNLTRSYKAGDAKDVVEAVKNLEGARLHGFEAVVAAGAKEITVFAHGDWVPTVLAVDLVYPITGMDRLLDFCALCAPKPDYKANKR
ncbi:putative neprosin, partial [Tanacetum coccineum]